MTLKEHKKHAHVEKPLGGKFGRNEFSIIGAPCGVIKNLSQAIANKLQEEFTIGFADADHQESEKPSYNNVYVDKISHHQFSFQKGDITYQYRSYFNEEDVVIVNGNHFSSEKQIVIINEKKKDSLSRKLDRLTDVRMFVLDGDNDQVYDFLKDHIPQIDNIPVFKIDDIEGIIGVIKKDIIVPGINGLVFAGGKSTRMGYDKGDIDYHGKPQREYLADILSEHTESTFISLAPESNVETDHKVIQDSFLDLGPFGGLLSAFRYDPNSAWISLACDIPLVDNDLIQDLISNRDISKIATCYYNPETDFPEPLITLWEPRAYPRLLHFLSLGYSCPRKVLINSDINMIKCKNPDQLKNVNTPDELEQIKSILAQTQV